MPGSPCKLSLGLAFSFSGCPELLIWGLGLGSVKERVKMRILGFGFWGWSYGVGFGVYEGAFKGMRDSGLGIELRLRAWGLGMKGYP